MLTLQFLDASRRDFIRYFGASAGAWLAYHVAAMHSDGWASLPQEFTPAAASAGGPAIPDWRTVLVAPTEPGEALVVSGVVYAADGHTPVPGARLYVFHTDKNGLYTLNGDDSRRPRIRGWMKTNAYGEYQFRTVKPGAYPGRRIPAHIHAAISAPGFAHRWLPEFWFAGDPFLGEKEILANIGRSRFSQVMRLERSPDGVLRAVRDILLG